MGVPAGRLSIEIVAEIARLQQDLDKAKRAVGQASRDIAASARHANDNLAGIGKGAGANIVQFSRDVARLKSQVDPAWAALQRYKEQVFLLSRALREGAISQDQYTKELMQARTVYQQAGAGIIKTTGAMQSGFQQAGFQVSDFFVQVGGGTSAIRAASQQLPQLTQAISLMGMGAAETGGRFMAFARFMSGPWGIAITVGVSVLGVLLQSLFDNEKGADKTGDAIKDLSQQFDFAAMSASQLAEVNQLLADANREVERTSIGAANATYQKASADQWAAQMALRRAKAEYERIAAFMSDPTFAEGAVGMGGYLEAAGATPEKMAELDRSIAALGLQANKAYFDMRTLTAGLDENGRKAETLRTKINDLRVEYQKSGDARFLQDALAAQAQLTELEDRSTRKTKERLTGTEKEYNRANEAAQDYIASLELEIAKIGLTDKALRALEVTRAMDAAATQAQRDEMAKLAKQREDALALFSASEFAKGLADETAALGVNTNVLKERSAVAAATAAADAAMSASTDEARQKLIEQSKAIMSNLRAWQARTAELELADYIKNTIEPLEREIEVLGLSGYAREKAIRQMEYEADIRALLAELAKAEADANIEAIRAINARIAARKRALDMEETIARHAQDAKDYEEALRASNEQLAEMARLLQNLGGLGGVLGGLLGIASGNYDRLGRGRVADLLSVILKTQVGERIDEKTGEKIAVLLGDELREVFGKRGIFGRTLAEVFESAGIGISASRIINGNNGKAGDIGAAIGGVVGNVVGTAFGGPIGGKIGEIVVGAIGGAIGGLFKEKKASIPGLLIGGLLGGIPGAILGGLLFGKSKYGTTSITNGGFSTVGNTGTYRDNSLEAAQGVQDTLAQIADALGATIGAYNVSIGQYKGKWRVSGSGMTGKLKGGDTVDFGKDGSAQALAYAIRDAISDGAIAGIRASTQTILRAGGDLQTQLEKAVKWEAILKEAEASGSAFTAALGDLKQEFDSIAVLAREAGASTEELASIQEFMIRKQRDLIEQAMAGYRSTFLSDAENLAFARKTITDTLTPLGFGNVTTVDQYKALVSATDALANPELFGALMELTDEFGAIKAAAEEAAQQASAAAEAEKALAQQRAALEIQILQAQGRDAEALAKQRELELSAADASLRTLLQDLYRAQDIAAARVDLADAYDRESRELEQTIDRMKSLGDSLREVRASIYGADTAAGGYAQALANLRRVGGMAAMGDEAAMGQLGGAIRDFLPAAAANARNLQDYQRAQALAARYADSAISAADMAVSLATQQLDEMKATVGQLIDLNTTALSVDEALQRLAAAGGNVPVVPAGSQQSAVVEARERTQRQIDRDARREAREEEREERRRVREERMQATLERQEQLWNRLTPDGLALTIRTDDDTPISTVAA